MTGSEQTHTKGLLRSVLQCSTKSSQLQLVEDKTGLITGKEAFMFEKLPRPENFLLNKQLPVPRV